MSELNFKWMGDLLQTLTPSGSIPTIVIDEDARIAEWVKEVGAIPDVTCPDIDRVIKCLDKAERALRNITSHSNSYKKTSCESDCSDYADDADSEISGLEDDLEKLRSSNEQLRELGKFWYEKCKFLVEENNRLKAVAS